MRLFLSLSAWFITYTSRQGAAEGLGRGTDPPKRSRRQNMLPLERAWEESALGFCCKSPAPGAWIWMHAPVVVRSWQWSRGGRTMDQRTINELYCGRWAGCPEIAFWQPSVLVSCALGSFPGSGRKCSKSFLISALLNTWLSIISCSK